MLPRLYKYEALSFQTLQNLQRRIIYFGSPLNFNDPFDCALTPNINCPSSDIEALRRYYLDRESTSEKVELRRAGVEQLRALFLDSAQRMFSTHREQFLNTRGVACFSEKPDDLLMWSHYGGRYKGICLEFSTVYEPFCAAQPVRYVSTLPSLNIRKLLLDNDFGIVTELFLTKSKAWKYEREWRRVHAAAGTEYCYPVEALTGIYFGPEIQQQSLECVCLSTVLLRHPGLRLWRGRRSTTEFRVVFDEFVPSMP